MPVSEAQDRPPSVTPAHPIAASRRSIRLVLLLPVVLIGLVGIALHTYSVYSSTLDGLYARYHSRVRILASTIAAVIDTRRLDESDDTLSAVVAQIGAVEHVACVAVIRRDPPAILACSDPARCEWLRTADPSALARLQDVRHEFSERRASGAELEYVRKVALPTAATAPPHDGLIYFLLDLARPIAEARAAVLRGALVLLTVFVGTTTLLFVMLQFAVLAPITQINRTIARRRAGDASAYVPLHGSTELGQLTRSFNDMLADADAREKEVRKLALVASRTENAIIITDAAARIEWVNEGFTRMTGFALADVRGRRPGALLQGPNTDPAVVALIRGRLARGLGFNAELVNYDRHGREYTVSIECQPIRDGAGQVTGFMAIQSNITERVAAYRALRASESKFRSLVESIPGAVYRCRFDQTRTMIHLSEAFAELSGYATRDLLDEAVRTFASLIHPEDVAYVEFVIRDALARRAPYALEYRLLTATGELRWVHDRGRAAFDGDGRVMHLDGVIIDITERKRVEEELRDARRAAEGADRAKSQFLANVSHEIRTPMTAILGYTELLLESERFRGNPPARGDGATDPDDAREALQTILRNGEHLLSVVNDILDLSKIEAGRFEVTDLECDPRALVENIAADLRERAAAKRLNLELAFEGPLPRRIRTDPLRLRQILINLVGNAIKFTDRGGVRLALRFRAGAAGA
ncbi:MAG: PAS domain S-box protein, partial [Phycisphaerae bacterium]